MRSDVGGGGVGVKRPDPMALSLCIFHLRHKHQAAHSCFLSVCELSKEQGRHMPSEYIPCTHRNY